MTLFDEEYKSDNILYHEAFEDKLFGDVEIIIVDDFKNIFKGDKK